MILTEQEIKRIGEGNTGSWQDDLMFARAIESAVLEKLKAQEPVAWRYKMTPPGWTYSDKKPDRDFFGTAWERIQVTPLYEHPLPPDDVVRDAERYRWITDCPRVPWGMFLPDDALVKVGIDAAIDDAMGETK